MRKIFLVLAVIVLTLGLVSIPMFGQTTKLLKAVDGTSLTNTFRDGVGAGLVSSSLYLDTAEIVIDCRDVYFNRPGLDTNIVVRFTADTSSGTDQIGRIMAEWRYRQVSRSPVWNRGDAGKGTAGPDTAQANWSTGIDTALQAIGVSSSGDSVNIFKIPALPTRYIELRYRTVSTAAGTCGVVVFTTEVEAVCK